MLELVGVVAGVAVAGLFLARGVLWGPPLVTALLFWLILAVTVPFLLRQPPPPVPGHSAGAGQSAAGLWRAVRQAPPAFLWWIVNRMLFWSAAIAIRTFLLNYLEDVFGLTPANAQALSSRILVILGLGVFLLAVPAGALADRLGRRPILIAAGLMAAAGTAIAMGWREVTALYVAGSLIAAGTGIFASASWSLATNLAPPEKGALYLALANGATVIGSISGRVGGALIDGINQLFDTVVAGYLVVFGLAALLFVVSSVVALKIAEPRQAG
ncbi:MAG: hypothetical protein Kow0031_15810 [Anaerolineae bacterium]